MSELPIVSEALPKLQFANYKLVPHPENPSKQLVVHVAPTAITAWHRPSLVGVFEGMTETQPEKRTDGTPGAVRLPDNKWIKIGYEGLPKADEHEELDRLQGLIRDGIEKDHSDWITFKKK